MNTRCKTGDLAIVVEAQNPGNVGLIVRVIEGPLPPMQANFGANAGPVWLCECAHDMTWTRQGRPYAARSGPIPDRALQPIRGVTTTARPASEHLTREG